MSENIKKTSELTITAILSAVVALVAFLPLKTLGLEISFAMVPVSIGAIVLGKKQGAFLGFVFGAVSFIQCFGYSPFGVMILSESVIKSFIVCVPTRIIAGFLTGLIFSSLKKYKISYILASVAAPLLNTVFFMSALVLCFYNGKTVQGFVETLGVANPLTFVFAFVGINGLVEIIAGAIVAFPVCIAVSKGIKRYI